MGYLKSAPEKIIPLIRAGLTFLDTSDEQYLELTPDDGPTVKLKKMMSVEHNGQETPTVEITVEMWGP